MTAHEKEAVTVLTKECESSIYRIQNSEAKDDCARCDPLSTGVVTLLRCQVARFELDKAMAELAEIVQARVARAQARAARTGAFVGGLTMGGAYVAWQVFQYIVKG